MTLTVGSQGSVVLTTLNPYSFDMGFIVQIMLNLAVRGSYFILSLHKIVAKVESLGYYNIIPADYFTAYIPSNVLVLRDGI